MFNRNEITSMQPPTRRHYAWHELEEYFPDGGMWAISNNALQRQKYISSARELMAHPPKFRAAMESVAKKWPKSMSVAMTTPGLNKKAWLGHAGCYIETGSPEECTRLAWHELDDGEQYAANDAAQQIIAQWEKAHMTMNSQMGLFDA